MITKKELLDAIAECEQGKPNYNTCEKLATFYTIYDHVHAEPKQQERVEAIQVEEVVVSHKGDTEFADLVDGMDAERAWQIVEELVEAVQVLHPKLYRSFVEKMAD